MECMKLTVIVKVNTRLIWHEGKPAVEVMTYKLYISMCIQSGPKPSLQLWWNIVKIQATALTWNCLYNIKKDFQVYTPVLNISTIDYLAGIW